MTETVLSPRALNRATLARQLLLQRSDRSVTEVVEHLVGLQAQTPHSWYLGLWNRIAGFRPEHAADLLERHQLVRIALMRSTIHLVTAPDALGLRPLVQPALDRDLYTNYTHGRPIHGIDMAALTNAARDLLNEQPRTPKQLGELLHAQWPDRPPATLAYAVRNQVPLVQVPPRGLWGHSGPTAHTTLETWLKTSSPSERASLPQLVLRYLAAFGPATIKDAQTWSGLTGLRAAFAALRPRLVTFRDENGRELFDLPNAPRPDPDTPTSPRFLYDFDNLLRSHADRSRVLTDDYRRHSRRPNGIVPAVVLLDGVTNGDWTITHDRDEATLTIRPYTRPTDQAIAALTDEGSRLLNFAAINADTRNIHIDDELFRQ